MTDKKKNKCKEKLVKRKPNEAKLFEVNDKRFMEDPFTVCVTGFK